MLSFNKDKNKKPTVNFHAGTRQLGVFPEPTAGTHSLPSYFPSIPPQLNTNPGSTTVKKCIPFLEASRLGYIIPLWCDVYVNAHDGDLQIEFPPNVPLKESLGKHDVAQIPNHPLVDTPYGSTPLKWINPWIVETDPGYSCIFTSPLNHLETRFKILDGVVDTDTYYNNVNLPFIWTGGDGDFVIPMGTPLVQVIPFKRTEMDMQIGLIDSDRQANVVDKIGTKVQGAYKSFFWNRLNGKK